MTERLNHMRQPTPVARLGCISASLARRGCADRWARRRMKNTKFYVLAATIAAATLLRAQASEAPPKPTAPAEPIAAILDAFRSHAIVALGNAEFRGNE